MHKHYKHTLTVLYTVWVLSWNTISADYDYRMSIRKSRNWYYNDLNLNLIVKWVNYTQRVMEASVMTDRNEPRSNTSAKLTDLFIIFLWVFITIYCAYTDIQTITDVMMDPSDNKNFFVICQLPTNHLPTVPPRDVTLGNCIFSKCCSYSDRAVTHMEGSAIYPLPHIPQVAMTG